MNVDLRPGLSKYVSLEDHTTEMSQLLDANLPDGETRMLH